MGNTWPMRYAMVAFLAALSLAAPHAGATDLTWRLDARDGSVSLHQFSYSHAGSDGIRGSVVWDPFVYLRLPREGIDTTRMRYLEVRLYSSAPADMLDVYYQSPNGDWALLGGPPIRRGWATYRMDLSTMVGHEGAGSASWGRWGGSEHRAASFRLDPGNQADRWLAISSVRLTDEPLADGVTEEPRGSLRSTRVAGPQNVTAGSTVRVSATVEPGPNAPAACTAYLRLMRGAMVIADREVRIDGRKPATQVTATFPTSRYLATGPLSVHAGVYELDGPAAECAMQFRNRREGVTKPPLVRVRRVGGDPTIVVDGKPLPGMAYLTAAGRRVPEHAEFARAGIHLYTDWFGSSTEGNLGHVAADRYDYGEFDAYFAEILDADPEARFIPHVYMTPPMWWQQANAAEMCRYADGGLGGQSFASAKWRADIGEDLRRLIKHLQSTSYADRILGYILCSGYTAEWQQWGIWEGHLADYSEPQRRGFAEWLGRKGRGGAEVAIPTPEERAASTAFGLRDPAREQRVIDYYQFASETIADAIAYFARVVKQASRGRSLAGSYYGYLTQHGPHQQDSGHLALARLLDAPEIDFLMSPPMYTGREAGGTSTFMSAIGSVRLHGKLWLNESDIRTSLSDPGADFSRAATLPASRAILQREFGEMLAHRTATSWFDMGGGWFSHPAILGDMAAMQRLARQSIASRKPTHGDIAVFISAEAAYRMPPANLWMPAVQMPVVDLPRVGVPADVYLLSDIKRPDFPRYKVYVFLNAAYVDAETRRAIDAKVKRGGATVVWAFAPGAVTDAGLSTASMRELTGIGIGIEMRTGVQRVRPASGNLGDLGPIGWDQEYGPLFWADDPTAEVLGKLVGSGKPGLVRKRMGGWTSIYFAGIGMPPALLRELAREAGAHVYLDTGDALDTDGQWACIHAHAAGPKTLRLPTVCRVENAMTGKLVAARTKAVTLTMQAAETVLLKLTPTEPQSTVHTKLPTKERR